MSAQGWGRVKEVFQAVLETEPATRASRVTELCGGDRQLLAEVEGLLAAHAAAGEFAERPADEMLAALSGFETDVTASEVRQFDPGERLGAYEIRVPLGCGGMGDVYEAWDPRLDRTVAIKVLRLGGSRSGRDRFEREARAVARLNHPHICTLHDVGHDGPVDYLVMEHLVGDTLARRLSRGPLPWTEAIEVAIQMASALDCAHCAGIVHRDLTPANIFLVRRSGGSGPPIAKLLDFGLAKAGAASGEVSVRPLDMREATPSTPLTRVGAFVGTIGYVAPEQIDGGAVDARSDLFALGVVLYESIAGRRAVEHASDAQEMTAVPEQQLKPLTDYQPEMPAVVDRIVSTCLARDPDDRFQTARDLHRALTWARDQTSSDSTQTTSGSPRRRLLGWGLAAVLALAAGTAMFWSGNAPPAAEPVTFSVYPPAGTRLPRGAAEMAIAPDGRRLVFVALSTDGIRRLWIRDFDAIDAHMVEGTDDASYPFWSPDGESLGFFANGTLRRIPAAGGRSEVLCRVGLGGQGASWSPNGTILFSSFGEAVRRVPDTGGQPQAVTVQDATAGESTHAWPVFLPDWHRFVYLARSGDPGRTAIFQRALDSGETHRLFTAESHPAIVAGHILSMERGSLIARPYDLVRGRLTGEPVTVATAIAEDSPLRSGGAFAAGGDPPVVAYRSASPVGRLLWFDRRGNITEVKAPPGDYQNPWLSPDEQRIAVERTDATTGRHAIWSVDERRGITSRLVADTSGAHMPVWSPDGRRIAFNSNRRGGIDLYRADADGSGTAELLLAATDRVGFIPMDWSSDGRQLLYSAGAGSQRRLWILPMQPRQEPHIWRSAAVSDAREDQGQFSTDGEWIAYTSNESGGYEVYISPVSGAGRRRQVSTNGGAQPRWRRDGQELFYLAPDGNLMAATVTARVDGIETGQPHALFNTGITASFVDRRNQYLVTRDGQRFLVNVSTEDQSSAPITVIVNWRPPRAS
jgi:serine/threonine protein kinase/Tol biopolymer transport system component